jgi:trehalose 6-phosphate synthase complex regulatory subunit
MQNDTKDVADLDISRVLPRYKHSATRLLLIDFEGTIWQRDPAALALRNQFDPPQEAIDALNKLAEDPKNEVWLLSGLQVQGALEKIAAAAPKIGIV